MKFFRLETRTKLSFLDSVFLNVKLLFQWVLKYSTKRPNFLKLFYRTQFEIFPTQIHRAHKEDLRCFVCLSHQSLHHNYHLEDTQRCFKAETHHRGFSAPEQHKVNRQRVLTHFVHSHRQRNIHTCLCLNYSLKTNKNQDFAYTCFAYTCVKRGNGIN